MGAFWNDKTVEPKRQYRFKLQLGNVEEWIVKSVSRPNFSITETPHQYINHTFYYPGRVEWQTTSFTIVDPVNPDATGKMMALLMASGYRFPVNPDGIRTVSKEEAVEAMGSMNISMFGTGAGEAAMAGHNTGTAGAKEIESWKLWNPWIQSVNFGDLAYDGDELTNIEVTVRYDYATWTPGKSRSFPDALTGKTIGIADTIKNAKLLLGH